MYESLGSFSCRKATLRDLVSMYNFIVPLITDETELKKTKKFLKYYVRYGYTCLVEQDNKLVGMYTGKDNTIHYIACKSSPKAALLLFYVVLCGIHNKYEESKFIAFESNTQIFEKIRTPEGKACIINTDGEGVVPPLTKYYVEQLFRRFKNERSTDTRRDK